VAFHKGEGNPSFKLKCVDLPFIWLNFGIVSSCVQVYIQGAFPYSIYNFVTVKDRSGNYKGIKENLVFKTNCPYNFENTTAKLQMKMPRSSIKQLSSALSKSFSQISFVFFSVSFLSFQCPCWVSKTVQRWARRAGRGGAGRSRGRRRGPSPRTPALSPSSPPQFRTRLRSPSQD